MPTLQCGCQIYFSGDNIIEFGKVCSKHNDGFTNFIGLIKEIITEARR